MSAIIARKLCINGRVQGIGFRPEVYRRAHRLEIAGWIYNDSSGVTIWGEAGAEKVDLFFEQLLADPPAHAIYTGVKQEEVEPQLYGAFSILESEEGATGLTEIPPDLAVCPECLADIYNRKDRRAQYPFTTCTYCGPRYTIIEDMPYDRHTTAMVSFLMCDTCRGEYTNPLDRRFHAQPVACPECGPSLRLYERTKKGGWVIRSENDMHTDTSDTPIVMARNALATGKIVAIKGLGGYHLAASAYHEEAVRELRCRKVRPDKPLALMIKDLSVVRLFCEISEAEEVLLTSQAAPIVLLNRRKGAERLAASIAPESRRLGVMLPYTPLHHLLLHETLDAVVMTSANRSGQPLISKEHVWFEDPSAALLADFLLTDNRPIANPIDDSVIVVQAQAGEKKESPIILRRARGYVPVSVEVPFETDRILALGGEQHAAFALGRKKRIYVSPYIGTASHVEIQERYLSTLGRYKHWFGSGIDTVACDAHPLYWTTDYAKQAANELNGSLIQVQHHHAHMAAVMAEHGLTDDCFGIVLDGTGYGLDGTLWGMEILYGNYTDFTRVASLDPIPLPGSEAAIKEPWRIGASMLYLACGEESVNRYLAARGKSGEAVFIKHMIDKGINTPYASSCGRLFDGVSSLLGLCEMATFDGQAAIRLMECAETGARGKESDQPSFYRDSLETVSATPDRLTPMLRIQWKRLISQVVQDMEKKLAEHIAWFFHETVCQMLFEALQKARKAGPDSWRKARIVILAGGSMQNHLLVSRLTDLLQKENYTVFRAETYPSGDGGLAVGQLAVASAKKNRI
ncbi:carbamoyltransferase HypF [Aneurinibacillus terranovensis]|uniref:carbamoyltransferase HypF n=1 Tax=Aneurinibacillus terranovensis TaxID=278991 RepID=UPI000402E80E|nr:carbamoyltransferase HypF [Aneurinibacillus terranovensis]